MRTPVALLVSLTLWPACADRPVPEPVDEPDEPIDTAPPDVPPPVYGVQLVARFGWDESEGDFAPVTIVDTEAAPSVLVLIYEEGVDDPVCVSIVEMELTGVLESGARWLPLEARATRALVDFRCQALEPPPFGHDPTSFLSSLTWRLALGGTLHEDFQPNDQQLARITGASFDVPGLIRPTDHAWAYGYRVLDDFTVLDGDPETPEVVDLVGIPADELQGEASVVDGYYQVSSSIHYLADP